MPRDKYSSEWELVERLESIERSFAATLKHIKESRRALQKLLSEKEQEAYNPPWRNDE